MLSLKLKLLNDSPVFFRLPEIGVVQIGMRVYPSAQNAPAGNDKIGAEQRFSRGCLKGEFVQWVVHIFDADVEFVLV